MHDHENAAGQDGPRCGPDLRVTVDESWVSARVLRVSEGRIGREPLPALQAVLGDDLGSYRPFEILAPRGTVFEVGEGAHVAWHVALEDGPPRLLARSTDFGAFRTAVSYVKGALCDADVFGNA